MDKSTSAPDDPIRAGREKDGGAPDHVNDTPTSSSGLPEIDGGSGDVAQLADKSIAAPGAVQDELGLVSTLNDDAGAAARTGGENSAGGAVLASPTDGANPAAGAPGGFADGDADLAHPADPGPDINASNLALGDAERLDRDASADQPAEAAADDHAAIAGAAHAPVRVPFDGEDTATAGGTANEARIANPASAPGGPAGLKWDKGAGPPDAVSDTQASSGGGRPEIDAGNGDLAQVSERSKAALVVRQEEFGIFCRNGEIVQAVPRQDGSVDIVAATLYVIRYLLARAAWFFKYDKSGQRCPAHPPMAAIRDIRASPDLPFRVLEAVVQRPYAARDGSIITTPGYHAASTTLLVADPTLVIPSVSRSPTADELKRAVRLIVHELLGDFPFVSAADRAHAVAMFLTPFLRLIIDGGVPLYAISKPNPGTGAGLLVETFCATCIGSGVALMAQPASDDEMRKKITEKLSTAPRVFIIDNLSHPLDFSSLAATLTTGQWEDRRLGVSTMVRVSTRGITFIVTANRLRVSLEMARRTALIRLDAHMASPWRRGGFRHPKLAHRAQENRGQLVWALLTMVAAYVAREHPSADNPQTLGSFESWASVMGGVLQVAGISGFLENASDLYAASDPVGEMMKVFIAAWWASKRDAPVGVSDVLELAERSGVDLGVGPDRSHQTRLGILLRGQANQRFIIDGEGGEKIAVELVAAGTGTGEHSGARQWSLRVPPGSGTDVTTGAEVPMA